MDYNVSLTNRSVLEEEAGGGSDNGLEDASTEASSAIPTVQPSVSHRNKRRIVGIPVLQAAYERLANSPKEPPRDKFSAIGEA